MPLPSPTLLLAALALPSALAVRTGVDAVANASTQAAARPSGYAIFADSSCRGPYSLEADDFVGNADHNELKEGIKKSGPWPSNRFSPMYTNGGVFGLFRTQRNWCRVDRFGSGVPFVHNCATVCDAMGDSCEAFSLVEMQGEVACCFTKTFEEATKENSEDSLELQHTSTCYVKSALRRYSAQNALISGVPLEHVQSPSGWQEDRTAGGHCFTTQDQELGRAAAHLACRRTCDAMLAGRRPGMDMRCSAFSLREALAKHTVAVATVPIRPRPMMKRRAFPDLAAMQFQEFLEKLKRPAILPMPPTGWESEWKSYQCCLYGEVGANEEVRSMAEGAQMGMNFVTRFNTMSYIAEDVDECRECEFGCLMTQRHQRVSLRLGLGRHTAWKPFQNMIPEEPGCDCPERRLPGGGKEYAVPVEGVCSWCGWREETSMQWINPEYVLREDGNPRELELMYAKASCTLTDCLGLECVSSPDSPATVECRLISSGELNSTAAPEHHAYVRDCEAVNTCIDNLPGCEGSCEFDWEGLRPVCTCGKGLIAKGTSCVPEHCESDAPWDQKRCPVGASNPCEDEPGGVCRSHDVPFEVVFQKCADLSAETGTWSVVMREPAVVERVDRCGSDHDFIWCCAEFTQREVEMQDEFMTKNVAEIGHWAAQASSIVSMEVAKVLARYESLAHKGIANNTQMKSVLSRLEAHSTDFEITVSLCAAGQLEWCGRSGRGGVRAFGQRARAYGRQLVAYARSANRLLDLAEYGTDSGALVSMLRFGARAQKTVAATWKFIWRHKFKFVLFYFLHSWALTLASTMTVTASMQLGTSGAVFQVLMRNVLSRVMCPMMQHPLVQGYVLRWLVNNILLDETVVGILDLALAPLGPLKGFLSWWAKMGGANENFRAELKEKFGKLGLGVWVVLGTITSTLVNGMIKMVCGGMTVVFDALNGVDKALDVTSGAVTNAYDKTVMGFWNFLGRKFGGQASSQAAGEIASIAADIDKLKRTAGQVPLQNIMLQATEGLLTYEKFRQAMQPLAEKLVLATGVMHYVGTFLGKLFHQILETLGLTKIRNGKPRPTRALRNFDKVQEIADTAKAALQQIQDSDLDSFRSQAASKLFGAEPFQDLCIDIAFAKSDMKGHTNTESRQESCPSANNGLMGLVGPNELKGAKLLDMKLDVTPLW